MKNNRISYQILILSISIFVLLFFTGCSIINLNKKEPEKTFFTFGDLKANPSKKNDQETFAKLLILDFTANADFKGRQFIYKGRNHFYKDYYNRFFISPEKMIKNKCAQWFRSKKSQLLFSDFILQGEILEIYCDRTEKRNPGAIIKIRFKLIEYNKTNKTLVEKDLYSGVKFSNFTPDNLMTAWTKCLKNIFTELESEISPLI